MLKLLLLLIIGGKIFLNFSGFSTFVKMPNDTKNKGLSKVLWKSEQNLGS